MVRIRMFVLSKGRRKEFLLLRAQLRAPSALAEEKGKNDKRQEWGLKAEERGVSVLSLSLHETPSTAQKSKMPHSMAVQKE